MGRGGDKRLGWCVTVENQTYISRDEGYRKKEGWNRKKTYQRNVGNSELNIQKSQGLDGFDLVHAEDL